ncbi:MAG: TetR/AcrR family transcriptional regulator [Myxococcota bacterium]
MSETEDLGLRRRPTQERAGRTFDSILDATAALLEMNGLAGLTTNAVAEAAGLTVPAVYRYFPNKEALLAALAERYLAADELWSEGIARLADPNAPLDEVVGSIIDSYASASDRFPAIGPLRTAMRALPVLAPLEERALERSSALLSRALAARMPRLSHRRRVQAARIVVDAVCNGVDRSRPLGATTRRGRRRELAALVTAYLSDLEAG